MSYHLVPPAAGASNDQHVVSAKSTAHPVSGTHDTFRYGLTSSEHTQNPQNASPLQARLEKWSATQHAMQETMQRNNFGLSVPLRQAMEMKIVNDSPHHPLMANNAGPSLSLGGNYNVSAEILAGTDETLDVGDFMANPVGSTDLSDVSSAMERSRRL